MVHAYVQLVITIRTERVWLARAHAILALIILFVLPVTQQLT